jgi:hypothetical protein
MDELNALEYEIYNKIKDKDFIVTGGKSYLAIVNDDLVKNLKEAFDKKFKDKENPFISYGWNVIFKKDPYIELTNLTKTSSDITTKYTDDKNNVMFSYSVDNNTSDAGKSNKSCDIEFFYHNKIKYYSLCNIITRFANSLKIKDQEFTKKDKSIIRLYLILKAEKKGLLYDTDSKRTSDIIKEQLESIKKSISEGEFSFFPNDADKKKKDKEKVAYIEKVFDLINKEIDKFKPTNLPQVKRKQILPKTSSSLWSW